MFTNNNACGSPHTELLLDRLLDRVVKVGSRRHCEEWAGSVAQITESPVTRITSQLDANTSGV